MRAALRQLTYPALAPRSPTPRCSILDEYKPLIATYLDDAPELTAVQVLQRLRQDRGYGGEISLVRRHLAAVHRQLREVLLRLTHMPGKVAQVDWAHCGRITIGRTRRRLSLFAMVLAYSRMIYVEFTLSERMDAFLEAHQRAFQFFGGVPDRCLYDNRKTEGLDRRDGRIVFHTRLLAETERAALTPLPSVAADTSHVEPVCANAYAEVRFDGNRYSSHGQRQPAWTSSKRTPRRRKRRRARGR